MEFYIFCLKSGVVRIVRDHELAVVTEELRAMELKACAVVDGEQIYILICGALSFKPFTLSSNLKPFLASATRY